MDRIADSSKAFTTGIDEKDIKYWVNIYIMGKAYKVPAGLTIMQAMEFAGYRFIRSAGHLIAQSPHWMQSKDLSAMASKSPLLASWM